MPVKILTKLKEWIGVCIAIAGLIAILSGYIVYLNDIAKDVENIKTNELVHIQASLDRLEKQKEDDNKRMTVMEKAISRIEGLLSR